MLTMRNPLIGQLRAGQILTVIIAHCEISTHDKYSLSSLIVRWQIDSYDIILLLRTFNVYIQISIEYSIFHVFTICNINIFMILFNVIILMILQRQFGNLIIFTCIYVLARLKTIISDMSDLGANLYTKNKPGLK